MSTLIPETDTFIQESGLEVYDPDTSDLVNSEDYYSNVYGNVLCKDVLTIVESYMQILPKFVNPVPIDYSSRKKYDHFVRPNDEGWSLNASSMRYNQFEAKIEKVVEKVVKYEYEDYKYETRRGTLIVHKLFVRGSPEAYRIKFISKKDQKYHSKKYNSKKNKWHYIRSRRELGVNPSCNFVVVPPNIDADSDELVFTKVFFDGRKEYVTIPHQSVRRYDWVSFVYNERFVVFQRSNLNFDIHTPMYFYDTVEKRYKCIKNTGSYAMFHAHEFTEPEKLEDCHKDSFILISRTKVIRSNFEGFLINEIDLEKDIMDHFCKTEKSNPYLADLVSNYHTYVNGGVINVESHSNRLPEYQDCYFGIKLIGF